MAISAAFTVGRPNAPALPLSGAAIPSGTFPEAHWAGQGSAASSGTVMARTLPSASAAMTGRLGLIVHSPCRPGGQEYGANENPGKLSPIPPDLTGSSTIKAML